MEEKEFLKKEKKGEIEEVREESEEKPETPKSPRSLLETSLEDYIDILEELRHDGIPETGGGFVDRGEPGSHDFTTGSFTTDNTWRDLDLSSIVPEGAKSVLFRLQIRGATTNRIFNLARNADADDYNVSRSELLVENVTHAFDIIVGCNTDRIMKYKIDDITWGFISLTVAGWWK